MTRGWTVAALTGTLEKDADRAAVIEFGPAGRRTLSRRDLAARVRRLAAGLRAQGLAPGARLVLTGPNGIDWVVVYLGAMAARLSVVPLDALMSAEEIAAVAQACDPALAVAGPDQIGAVRAALPDTRCLALLRDGPAAHWESLLAEDEEAPAPDPDPDDEAVMMQTSGTTGAAKLFALKARQLGANLETLASSGLAKPGDRLLLPLPAHHVYPQVVGLLATLTAGATIVLPAAVTGPALMTALRETRATGIVAVPRLYAALLDGLAGRIREKSRLAHGVYAYALGLSALAARRLGWRFGSILLAPVRRRLSPDLKLLVSGGARLDPDLAWRLVGLGFDIRSGYGLAETAASHTGDIGARAHPGTAGPVLPGGEIRIDAPDEHGIGEILLRGPNLFDGYLDPARNEGALLPDGWFRTGDLGFLDRADCLVVTGRVKEVIVLGGGKKIDPEGLEARYGACPYLAEIAVLERDGRLVAVARPDRAALAKAGLAREEPPIRVALGDIARGLPDYQRLAGFALVSAPLPRTRLGKLRRFMLPDLYDRAKAGAGRGEAAAKPEDDPLLARPRAGAAWRLIRRRYPDKPVALDAYLGLDLGMDSLEWIGLSLALEQALDIDLEGVDPAKVATLRGLLEAVEAAPKGAPQSHGEADFAEWEAPVPAWARAVAGAAHAVNRWGVRGLMGLDVSGLAHVPRHGPYTIICNHQSYLDAPVLAAALPGRLARALNWGAARAALPGGQRLTWFYRALNVFPLDEGATAFGLARARAAHAAGRAVAIFPEGWRSADGRLQPFLPGIGHLHEGTDVPVVPAWIDGAFEAWPRHRRLPRRHRLRLRFGPPESPDALARAGAGATVAERIAAGARAAVAALADPPPA